MKQKTILAIIIGVSFLFSGAISAQTPKQILKRATKAIGGKKKLKSIKSFQKRGLITRLKDGANGDFTVQGAKPDLFNSKFDLRGFETEVGFNGKSGWMRDSREGLRTLTGEMGDHFKEEAVYRNWRWINHKKRKGKIIAGGQTTIDGKTTNIVILTNPKAVSIKLYFDAATNLLIREEIPLGKTTQTFDYSDYRPTNGIKEAFKILTELNGERFEIKIDQIVYNKQIAQSAFNFPKVLGKPLPEIPKLLKELQENETRIEKILENYSFTEKLTKRKLEKNGTLSAQSSETQQLSFYKGYRIHRLIAKNGKPLTKPQQEKEDKAVGKRVKKIEKKIAKKENQKGKSNGEGDRISIAELLRASKLSNPRREVLQGREVIVFDFEPDPSFDFKNAKSFLKFFGKTVGVMWIDEHDKQVARLEAVLFNSYKIGGGLLAKLRKGASFTLEKQRLNNEIWLPSLADINLSVRVLLIGGVKVNQVVTYSDYRKFKTEVEDSKVNDIKKP